MSLEVHVRKDLGDFTLDVSLEHSSGVMGILGASGCGKSMTLQAIAGVVRPDAGRIVLNGRVLFDSERKINLPPQERHVGYLFQNYALFPNMTVERNIMCGAPRKLPREKKRELARKWISNMQLEGLENQRPNQLSGGQQQRTALARVLVGTPEILLLDEPFSALDSHLRDQLLTELRTLLRTVDKEALLVTHNRNEVYELTTSLAIMANGRILGSGTTKGIFADPQTQAAAILTGCKNVVAAHKCAANEVYVPDWGVKFTAAGPVADEVCAIGIRAHYFSPDVSANAHPIQIVDAVEEPFAWIVKFRYNTQKPETPEVWWRLPKDRTDEERETPKTLGVDPSDVLLLR